MKLAPLVIFLVLVVMAGRANCQNTDHVQWVAQSLSAMQTIKVGMTRGDLEKVFVEGGGLSNRSTKTYAYRACPFFKVDVEFEADAASRSAESPKDKITRISKPYLDWSKGD